MTKELAKTLTTALVQFIDRERPEGTLCCSSYECEKIEKAFEGGTYDVVEKLIKKKLLDMTEFEDKLVSFALQCGGQWDTANEEAKKWSNEFLTLAKKELLSYPNESNPAIEAMADLERTFECNPDKLPKWLKNALLQKYLVGYDKGREEERRYGSQKPMCWEPGGTCPNPHHDCIICPGKYSSGGTITTLNTSSGTSTLKAEG